MAALLWLKRHESGCASCGGAVCLGSGKSVMQGHGRDLVRSTRALSPLISQLQGAEFDAGTSTLCIWEFVPKALGPHVPRPKLQTKFTQKFSELRHACSGAVLLLVRLANISDAARSHARRVLPAKAFRWLGFIYKPRMLGSSRKRSNSIGINNARIVKVSRVILSGCVPLRNIQRRRQSDVNPAKESGASRQHASGFYSMC